MDGYLQLAEHLLVTGFADDILGDELVFQTIVDKILGGDSTVEQLAYLVDHTLFEALLETLRYLAATLLAIDVHSDDDRVYGWQRAVVCGVLEIIGLYLYGAYGALRGVHISPVVHHRMVAMLQVFKHFGEFGERLVCQLITQCLVLWHGRQGVSLEHTLNIETRTSAENRTHPARHYIIINKVEVLLILEEVILGTGFTNIYQVVRYHAVALTVVVEVFARADGHATIHLTRVGTDNLGIDTRGKGGSQTGFARRRRTQYGNHLLHLLLSATASPCLHYTSHQGQRAVYLLQR